MVTTLKSKGLLHWACACIIAQMTCLDTDCKHNRLTFNSDTHIIFVCDSKMASDEGNVSDVETSKESNEEKENDICSEYFVELLEKHGQPLLSKSRVPIAKREKNIALDTMSKVISKQKGIAYTSTQILAKFSKMKTRTKQKADVNRTGNRKIVLSEIEKRFWEFLSGYDNPALNKLPCE